MSTYKSTKSANIIDIERFAGAVNFTVSNDRTAMGIGIADDDAEAAALAVLEAGNLGQSPVAELLRSSIRKAEEAKATAAKAEAEAKLTARRDKYVRDIAEEAGRVVWDGLKYSEASGGIQAAVRLLVAAEDALIEMEAGR